MRLYQPKNELGQALLNEGQLVQTSKTITKSLVDGVITLTESEFAGITNWEVDGVTVTISGENASFVPEVIKTAEGFRITFAEDNFAKLEFNEAVLKLQLVDCQGLTMGGGNNLLLKNQ